MIVLIINYTSGVVRSNSLKSLLEWENSSTLCDWTLSTVVALETKLSIAVASLWMDVYREEVKASQYRRWIYSISLCKGARLITKHPTRSSSLFLNGIKISIWSTEVRQWTHLDKVDTSSFFFLAAWNATSQSWGSQSSRSNSVSRSTRAGKIQTLNCSLNLSSSTNSFPEAAKTWPNRPPCLLKYQMKGFMGSITSFYWDSLLLDNFRENAGMTRLIHETFEM